MGLFSSAPLSPGESESIPEDENRVLDKLAQKVVEWRMAPVGILYLESFKPMNYVASQGMVFLGPIFEPLLEMFFNFKDYDTLRRAMERRSNVENLILKIERYESVAGVREKMIKKFLKVEKRKWNWYQRWLGIATPKFEYPDEIKKFDWRKAAQDEDRTN